MKVAGNFEKHVKDEAKSTRVIIERCCGLGDFLENYYKNLEKWETFQPELFDMKDLLINKPATAQVGAISQAQNSKRTSKCQVFSSTVPE